MPESREMTREELVARISALEAELVVARESNARLNRRAQEAEAKAARVEKIERRIAERNTRKPLPRIEAAYALAAAETRIEELERAVADGTEALRVAQGLRDGHPAMCCGACHDTLEALRSEVERLRQWARFGARAFEDFWQDGYPGDLEGGDLQEMARECGLLGRTADVDAGATHADGCDWQPGMHVDDCDCWAPLLAPYKQEDSNA